MAQTKKNLEGKSKLQAKKARKMKRKQVLKVILVLILAALMIGISVAPIFAETTGDVAQTYTLKVGEPDSNKQTLDTQFQSLIDYIESNYYQDVDENALIDGAYKGMLDVLDKHSIYFTPDEYNDFMTDLSGEFSGVGASISVSDDGHIEVVSPIKDMPAEKAGLKAGDIIMTVDGESTEGWSTEQAVSVIRGQEGTAVTLEIKRVGQKDLMTFKIVRDTIVVNTVDYKVLDNGIGYISISQFGEKTNDEFDKAMAYMANNDIKQLIVDVRNNPGGYLSAATHISDYFVDEGKTIVKEQLGDGTSQTYRALTERVPMDVAVLVNAGSASASEIFSGSIQQTGNGVVIGTNTYGKGTVQTIRNMGETGAVKLTIAEYLLNGDYHVDGVGIKPDIEVALPSQADYEAYETFAPMNETVSHYSGEASLNVYGAQQRLNLLGSQLTVDGVLGYNTEATLKTFQKSHGLPANGILDMKTVVALNKAVDTLFDGSQDTVLDTAIEYFNNRK